MTSFFRIRGEVVHVEISGVTSVRMIALKCDSKTKLDKFIYNSLIKWIPDYSSGSIEIDPIDVSNLRRFSSCRNRIGSNRTNVTKSTVRPGFEYTLFASTLNPMGKRLCLEIEGYASDTHSKTRRRMRQKTKCQSNK